MDVAASQRRLSVLGRQINAGADSGTLCLKLAGEQRGEGRLPSPPVLVGGMVLDIMGYPAQGRHPAAGTTVPGEIRQSPGGVARNIAECLAALVAGWFPAPLLLSAVGNDPAGDFLVNHLSGLGMETRGVRRCQSTTPTVAVIFDGAGEVSAAIADVKALDDTHEAKLQTIWMQGFSDDVSRAPLVLLDANLDESTMLQTLKAAAAAGAPTWFEPVSVAKSVRAASLFPLITIVSPNQAELQAMAAAAGYHGSNASSPGRHNDPLHEEAYVELQRLAPHAAAVLKAGVKHVVATLGPNGAVVYSLPHKGGGRELDTTMRAYHVPALPAKVVGVTGAGDSLVAGCIAGLLRGWDIHKALHAGVAASKIVVQSPHNVPPELTMANVFQETMLSLLGSTAYVFPCQ